MAQQSMSYRVRASLRPVALAVAALLLPGWALHAPAVGQPAAQVDRPPRDLADEQFDAAMASEPQKKPVPARAVATGMNLLEMASPRVGGVFMYPIYAFSFLVVLFGIERLIGLRRRKVLPGKLERGLDEMLKSSGSSFDPRQAWRLCQKYPSAAARVVQAALLQTGRPPVELESTLTKATEREAARLYANVRPLNLSATVAPLLGLAGTVQGMILAFYETAHLPDGANKAQALAAGVYIALITTFAGLCVAIPAVVLAHYFEGKIQRLFARLEELTQRLLPVLERYEGRVRMGFMNSASAEAEAAESIKTAATSE